MKSKKILIICIGVLILLTGAASLYVYLKKPNQFASSVGIKKSSQQNKPIDDMRCVRVNKKKSLPISTEWVVIRTVPNQNKDSLSEILQRISQVDTSKQFSESSPETFLIPLHRGISPSELPNVLQKISSLKEQILWANPVFVTADNTLSLLTDEIIVEFSQGVEESSINEIAKSHHAEVIKKILTSSNFYLFKMLPESPENALELANELEEKCTAKSAEPNYILVQKSQI